MSTTCFEEIGAIADMIRRNESYDVSKIDIYLETEADKKDHIRGSIELSASTESDMSVEIMIDSYDLHIDYTGDAPEGTVDRAIIDSLLGNIGYFDVSVSTL